MSKIMIIMIIIKSEKFFEVKRLNSYVDLTSQIVNLATALPFSLYSLYGSYFESETH